MCIHSVILHTEFGIACLGKKTFSYGNLRISRIMNFKNMSFSSGLGVVQIKQTRYRVSHGYLECKTKRFFGIACIGKKLGFHKIRYSRNSNFKNRSFSSGQGNVQIEPNSVSIHCVLRLLERILSIACLGKKLVFHTEIALFAKFANFRKNNFFPIKLYQKIFLF